MPRSNLSQIAKLTLIALMFSCAFRPFSRRPEVIRTQQQLSLSDPAAAAKAIELEIASTPEAKEVSELKLYAGEWRRLADDSDLAKSWFTMVLQKHPSSEQRGAALLGLAVLNSEQGFNNRLLEQLESTPELGLPKTLNADRYRLLFRYYRTSNPEKSNDYLSKALRYADAHDVTKRKLEQEQAQRPADPVTQKAPNAQQFVDAITFQFSERNYQKVIELGTTFLNAFPSTKETNAEDTKTEESKDGPETEAAEAPREDDAADKDTAPPPVPIENWEPPQRQKQRALVSALIDRAKIADSLSSNKACVLLPSSGTYAPAATAIRQALEFANTQSGSNLDLYFADSGWPKPAEGESNPSLAEHEKRMKEIVRDLRLNQGCALAIGPLLRENVMAAARAAQNYGLPLLVMARSQDPVRVGDQIFRISISKRQQIVALLNHAIDERGFKSFAAMIPNDPDGITALQIFTEEAEKRGATVVRSVAYDPSAKSFLDEARVIGQKPEKRPTKKQLEKDRTIDHPIVDFDAFFIPDNFKRVPLVVSSLAYEEFSIGGFRINRHATPVPVLGLSGWNHPSIVEKGGQYIIGGVFVDAFWTGTESETVQEFITSYQEKHGRSANIFDALSYDVIQMAAAALSGQQPDSTETVRKNLLNGRINNPITSGARFGSDRELNRTLKVLTIVRRNGIQEWQAPEKKENE